MTQRYDAKLAAAYARGVEDAAKVAEQAFEMREFARGCDEMVSCDRDEIAERIRSLLPKEPATEDAREKEVTECEDLQAAECIRYYQAREADER